MLVKRRDHRTRFNCYVSNPRLRPGPKPRDLVRLDTKITPTLDHGLDEVVIATGVSKASIVRLAIARLLAEQGVLASDHPDLIDPTPSTGPGLASQRKDTP